MRYCIYIEQDRLRHYLQDWIMCDSGSHLVFNTDPARVMKFRKFETALAYRNRMVEMGYEPHIESIA